MASIQAFADTLSRPSEHVGGRGFSVRRLTLTDFRCYRTLRLVAGPGLVVLTGPNGAGKTNILEAISYLGPGRGLRRAKVSDPVRRGAAAWAVAADLDCPAGSVAVGTGLIADEGEAPRRTVRIDGQPAGSGGSLARYFALAWLTPQMDRLFVEDAAGRRRFFDRLVYAFDPLHARRLSAYERALRERVRLLRSSAGDAWLSAIEQTMAEHAVAIAAARRDLLGRLQRALGQPRGPFPGAALAVEGTIEAWLETLPAVDVETGMRSKLRESRLIDRESGGATIGPHRSDLIAHHLGHGMPAGLCSTGEQKSLLVSIVLTHARLAAGHLGGAPALLLDEVVAHLDEGHREALFAELRSLAGQIWLTGTDRTTFGSLRQDAQFFSVNAGSAQPD